LVQVKRGAKVGGQFVLRKHWFRFIFRQKARKLIVSFF